MDYWNQKEKRRREKKKQIIKYTLIGVAVLIAIWFAFGIGQSYGRIQTEISKPFVEESFILEEGDYIVGSKNLPAGYYILRTLEDGEVAFLTYLRKDGKHGGADYIYYKNYDGPDSDGTFRMMLSDGDRVSIEWSSLLFTTFDKYADIR